MLKDLENQARRGAFARMTTIRSATSIYSADGRTWVVEALANDFSFIRDLTAALHHEFDTGRQNDAQLAKLVRDCVTGNLEGTNEYQRAYERALLDMDQIARDLVVEQDIDAALLARAE